MKTHHILIPLRQYHNHNLGKPALVSLTVHAFIFLYTRLRYSKSHPILYILSYDIYLPNTIALGTS